MCITHDSRCPLLGNAAFLLWSCANVFSTIMGACELQRWFKLFKSVIMLNNAKWGSHFINLLLLRNHFEAQFCVHFLHTTGCCASFRLEPYLSCVDNPIRIFL